jgi:hypothetical protein
LIPPSIDPQIHSHHQTLVHLHNSELKKLKDEYQDDLLEQRTKTETLLQEQITLNTNLDIRSTLLKSIGLQNQERDRYLNQVKDFKQRLSNADYLLKEELERRKELE